MSRAICFAVVVVSSAACGGGVAPVVDSGDAGSAPGSSMGTAGGSGTDAGASSSGGPSASSSLGSAGVGDAGDGALTRPTMGNPVTDAAVFLPPRDAAAIRCNNGGPGGGGGSGGPGTCSAFADETCSGVSYSVSCACPQGTCACQGPSSMFIAFAGCPVCPTSPQQLFAACGFPQ